MNVLRLAGIATGLGLGAFILIMFGLERRNKENVKKGSLVHE